MKNIAMALLVISAMLGASALAANSCCANSGACCEKQMSCCKE